MESPGKETGTVEGRGEKGGGLREDLFDLIWLPCRDLDPLRSRKERVQTEGDAEGIGKRKW